MKSIQDIIDLLDDVPEDAIAYEYIGSKKEEIEYGYLCARAKVTIQQLLSHSQKLPKELKDNVTAYFNSKIKES